MSCVESLAPTTHRVDSPSMSIGRRSVLGWVLAALACGGSERSTEVPPVVEASPEGDGSTPTAPPRTDVGAPASGTEVAPPPRPPKPSGPPPDVWPALPETYVPPTTDDGIPILAVTTSAAASPGALREISPAWNTLVFAQQQASDGLSTFVAVRNDAQTYSDVVIRGGELRTNVLQGLAGVDDHPGGCGIANDGIMLLSAPAPVPGETITQVTIRNGVRTSAEVPRLAQSIWIVTPDGTLVRHRLPPEAGDSAECKGVLESADRFALFSSFLVEYDGASFKIDRDWYSGRTHLSRPFGPKYCFQYCNRTEEAGTDATVKTTLAGALGSCPSPQYAVLGDVIVARCQQSGIVARLDASTGALETIKGVPKADWMADGVFLTREGHAVIELALQMKRYVVWPAGAKSLGPERTLADDEVLAQTSPTVLVRDLPEPVPPAEVYAVVMGESLPFGANGSTLGYSELRRGPAAHAARAKRAADVLPKGDFVIAHEAAVQLGCGAYVRTPLGWEDEMIHDWVPPGLPPLSSKAVHVPATCLPLAEVHASPGVPDLLLAKTKDGELATAWLPPPLPLPSGYDPREDEGPEPAPKQDPKPGPGWVTHGAVDSIAGDRGQASPGGDTARLSGWQRGGGALLTADGATIVLTPRGAWTVPDGAVGMAVQTGPTGKLYGALGNMLVVCEEQCRTLDPGDGRDIVGVVPRTQGEVILGFGDDETAVYRVPRTGGVVTPSHRLEAVLEARLKDRPRP